MSARTSVYLSFWYLSDILSNLIYVVLSRKKLNLTVYFVDTINKLKSLKVAQVKDEMEDEEDDGCEGVHDVAW